MFHVQVVGCCLCSVGLWLLSERLSLYDDSQAGIDNLTMILSLLGLGLIIISLLGYCGAVQGNKDILNIYTRAVIFILASQVTLFLH